MVLDLDKSSNLIGVKYIHEWTTDWLSEHSPRWLALTKKITQKCEMRVKWMVFSQRPSADRGAEETLGSRLHKTSLKGDRWRYTGKLTLMRLFRLSFLKQKTIMYCSDKKNGMTPCSLAPRKENGDEGKQSCCRTNCFYSTSLSKHQLVWEDKNSG